MSKANKLKNEQLKTLVDRLVKHQVSLELFLEKFALNNDYGLVFPALEYELDINGHSQFVVANSEETNIFDARSISDSINAEYDFYSEPQIGFHHEPITSVQSSDLGPNKEAYEERTIRLDSLSHAIQSSRDLLYGNSINDDDNSRNFEMVVNCTESHAAIPTAISLDVIQSPAKRTQLINIGVSSKRANLQNHIAD